MNITIKKVKHVRDTKRYPPKEDPKNKYEELPVLVSGLFQVDCEDQNFDVLDPEQNEALVITFEHIPFISFEVLPHEGQYGVSSISPISLRTFEEQKYRKEKWGLFNNTRECIDKAISVMGGFVNGLGKISENKGDYYG